MVNVTGQKTEERKKKQKKKKRNEYQGNVKQKESVIKRKEKGVQASGRFRRCTTRAKRKGQGHRKRK